jgi:hypothetical protein
MKQKFNKDGNTTEIEKTEKEMDIKTRADVKHSLIWGFVVIFIVFLVYMMIRYGKCAC